MGARPRVVIVGAGFGGLAAAKRLENEAVDVSLVDRHNYHTFQPLLYQVATAGLSASDVGYVVRGLFRRQQRVFFRKADVIGVDWDTDQVELRHEDPLRFDYLIVAAGSSTNYFGTPGADEFAFPLYGLEDAVRFRNHIVSLFEAADAVPALIDEGVLTLTVVGGGPTGVEVAGALAELVERVLVDDFHDMDARRARVILVEQAPRLLGAFNDRSARYALRTLEARGVEVRLGTTVKSVHPDHVELGDGEVIATRALVWAAGVQANALAGRLGLPQGRGGRITVGADLSVADHPNVFVVGDLSDVDDSAGGRLPQLAQPAIQEGKHAAEQVLHTINRQPRTAFSYFDKGTMATIGRRAAVAELPKGITLTGAPAWLAWLGLHLIYLLGVRNRISVFLNWAWNYFTWDRGPRLILRPEVLPHTPHPHSDSTDSG
jgi:NADH dehydrogenase